MRQSWRALSGLPDVFQMATAYESKEVNFETFGVTLIPDLSIIFCAFGGKLLTIELPWLPIGGLCCGKRQLLIFGTNF